MLHEQRLGPYSSCSGSFQGLRAPCYGTYIYIYIRVYTFITTILMVLTIMVCFVVGLSKRLGLFGLEIFRSSVVPTYKQ